MKYFASVLLFLCFGGFDAAIAQIVYTDIVPDTTIAPPMNSGYNIRLDLDKDGNTDFSLTADNMGGTYDKVTITGSAQFDQIAGEGSTAASMNFFPLAFRTGDRIDGDTSIHWTNFWDNSFGHGLPSVVAGYGLSGQGNWITKLTGFYLGVRKRVNGSWRYGWIGMDVAPAANMVTVRSFAIEGSPDTPILAGATGLTGLEDTPSPDRIAFLSTGRTLTVLLGSALQSAHIVLHDMMGRRIRALFTQTARAVFDLSDLPRGLYIVVSGTGLGSIVQKIAMY
jgi:hypothetical protein